MSFMSPSYAIIGLIVNIIIAAIAIPLIYKNNKIMNEGFNKGIIAFLKGKDFNREDLITSLVISFIAIPVAIYLGVLFWPFMLGISIGAGIGWSIRTYNKLNRRLEQEQKFRNYKG